MCGCLSCVPPPGTWHAPQACALTGNRTGDPLVLRPTLNPLSHTSQGLPFLNLIFLMQEFFQTSFFIQPGYGRFSTFPERRKKCAT